MATSKTDSIQIPTLDIEEECEFLSCVSNEDDLRLINSYKNDTVKILETKNKVNWAISDFTQNNENWKK